MLSALVPPFLASLVLLVGRDASGLRLNCQGGWSRVDLVIGERLHQMDLGGLNRRKSVGMVVFEEGW